MVGSRRADIVHFFVHQPRLPRQICLNYEDHETVTGNQEPERIWMIATLLLPWFSSIWPQYSKFIVILQF